MKLINQSKAHYWFQMLTAALVLGASGTAMAEANRAIWMRGKYGVMVHYIYDLAGANGVDGIGKTSTGAIDSWANAKSLFNVNKFVDDVKLTGASYILFTSAQSEGRFAAGSAVVDNMMSFAESQNNPGILVSGDVAEAKRRFLGGRNLLLDIANAVRTRAPGMKFFVYIASEGPTAAVNAPPGAADPNMDRRYGLWLSGPSGFDCLANGALRSDAFRAKYNAMIQEWSLALGDKIDGWWIDAAGTYWNVLAPNGTDIIGEHPSGDAKMNQLIYACRAGNPNAMVGSSIPETFSGFRNWTTEADFSPGEMFRFARFPTAAIEFPIATNKMLSPQGTPVSAGMQWCLTSFLGNTWGEGSATRYHSNQLANFVAATTSRNGSMIIDMKVNKFGRLITAQRNQMNVVKAAVVGTPPAAPLGIRDFQTSGLFGRTGVTNYAMYKPSWMSNESITNPAEINSTTRYATFGNDDQKNGTDVNVPVAAAVAGGVPLWSYIVDLGAGKPVTAYALIVRNTSVNSSFSFTVQGSHDGANWINIPTSAPGSTATVGTYAQRGSAYAGNFNWASELGRLSNGQPYVFRYYRVKNLNDASGMDITEFQLF
jgi:hypothetical protein